MLLKPLAQENDYSCESTEDLLAAVNELNKCNNGKGVKGNLVIGSLDVKALYPSLDIEAAIEIMSQTFVNSDFEVESINTSELGLYLAVNTSKKALDQLGFGDYCPTRRHNRGAHPKITGCATSEKEKERFAPWLPPPSIPRDQK